MEPNLIPDQVADRSCMSHEYVFHFVTQRFYYYNRVAVGRKTSKGTHMPPTDTWEVPLSKGGPSHKASFSEELVRIEEYEARMKHRPPVPLGRMSAYPRVLSLRELVKALK